MDAPTLEQVRIGLKLFNYGSVLIGLHFARFVHLSVEQRLAYIRRWEDGIEIQRGISTVLKKLVCYGYWKDIEAGRAIGYQGPVSEAGGIPSLGNAPMPKPERVSGWQANPKRRDQEPRLKVTQPERIPDAGLTLDADVVVIGSGAAGAVTAYELSRSGAKVVVLEAGPYIPSSQFQEHAQRRSRRCTRTTAIR